jgi:hypothetical protein
VTPLSGKAKQAGQGIRLAFYESAGDETETQDRKRAIQAEEQWLEEPAVESVPRVFCTKGHPEP